jgi:hypothetical protein
MANDRSSAAQEAHSARWRSTERFSLGKRSSAIRPTNKEWISVHFIFFSRFISAFPQLAHRSLDQLIHRLGEASHDSRNLV